MNQIQCFSNSKHANMIAFLLVQLMIPLVKYHCYIYPHIHSIQLIPHKFNYSTDYAINTKRVYLPVHVYSLFDL